jgi:hypothetical protein
VVKLVFQALALIKETCITFFFNLEGAKSYFSIVHYCYYYLLMNSTVDESTLI